MVDVVLKRFNTNGMDVIPPKRNRIDSTDADMAEGIYDLYRL